MRKINLLSVFIISSLFILQMSQTACTNDKLPEPTINPICDSLAIIYDDQIKPIIDGSCAYVGCHSESAAIGDYTSYLKMLPTLNDDKFKKRVIDFMDMPENDMLSSEEFELVECWVTAGYPEN